jgi:hypothetical protein
MCRTVRGVMVIPDMASSLPRSGRTAHDRIK